MSLSCYKLETLFTAMIFLVECEFPELFNLQFGASTLFLLPSLMELKRLGNLLIGTDLLLYNLRLS